MSLLMFAAAQSTDSGNHNTISTLDSLLVFVLGMVMIFLVLTVLIVCVLAYRGAFSALSGKDKEKREKQPEPKPTPAPAVQPQAVKVTSEDEIAAVIGAVMAIYYAENGAASGKTAPFRVKSILRLK